MKRLALLLLITLAACGAQPTATPTVERAADGAIIASDSHLLVRSDGKLAEGDPAPDFSFSLPDGTTQRLSELRGKPVLLNFWASWCRPCAEEMPTIQQAYAAANGKLVVLAVNRNELPEALARFTHTVSLSFPLIANPTGDIGDGYGVTGLPVSYFITSDGLIAARHIGALDAKTLQQRLDPLQ